ILRLQKKRCVLTIEHHKWKFYHRRWIVDVCREPVHIKKGVRFIDVVKKESKCPDGTSFCKELSQVEGILANDGLIFADGEKDNLAVDHGKVYWSYLLVEKYLRDGVVLRRSQKVNIFQKEDLPAKINQKETTVVPCKEKQESVDEQKEISKKESLPEAVDKNQAN
ncbi:MAG: hypothetical protein OXB88_03305, partial [Bacteriovoracales bacterium]|nr:hypothetical protein [Bacteriovoracales bacterium]